jgi:hypothetical protein
MAAAATGAARAASTASQSRLRKRVIDILLLRA